MLSAASPPRRRLRVVVATPQFPNRLESHAAPFNLRQVKALSAHADVEVVAPIPWFPLAGMLGHRTRAASLATVPRVDTIEGLAVRHPRRPYVPRIAPLANGPLATVAYAGELRALCRWGDVVLATWAYPDAWAVIAVAKLLGTPVVVKVHGSDLNLIARAPGPRALLRLLLPRANAVVAVSTSLQDAAMELGVNRERAFVVRNGVDRQLFKPGDRQAARRRTGLPEDARIVLFVGRLLPAKGVGELLAAFVALARDERTHLVVVGDGPLRGECGRAARIFPGRVIVCGELSAPEVADLMTAADVLTLPSWSEGVPNVLLEAVASGRRVVATKVGGIPEVVDERVGTLVPARNVPALIAALEAELGAGYDQQTISGRAAPDWSASSQQLLRVLETACGRGRQEVGPC